MIDFRLAYRAWLASNVSADWRQGCAGNRRALVALARTRMAELNSGGYGGRGWPIEHGGMGASLADQIVMIEEEALADVPSIAVFSIGLVHTGSTLIQHGTDEQCRQHLPKILSGDVLWCQGFSEPNAGSDLASLQCRAMRDGENYVVNGQKVWSSNADVADWCLLLVRTDPDAPKRNGISYLMLDLRSPGVEVRPLRQITGTAEFSEIFLDDVVVPVANRIGAENDGWRVSQTTLQSERGPLFLPSIQRLRSRVGDAIDDLCDTGAADDPLVRQSLAGCYAEIEILAELYGQVLSDQINVGEAGSGAAIIKLCYSEILNQFTGTVSDALGLCGLRGGPQSPDDDGEMDWFNDHLHSWGMTIGGGTSDIQRNLIGEHVLGLPRDPSVA